MHPGKELQPQEAREQELERALKRLAAGVEPESVMQDMSRRLVNKLLHRPLTELREILPSNALP